MKFNYKSKEKQTAPQTSWLKALCRFAVRAVLFFVLDIWGCCMFLDQRLALMQRGWGRLH